MMKLTGRQFFGETFWIILLMAALAAFFLSLALLSGGVYGGADTYLHYAISHYAFRYPHLLLDHWGKPLFTALSSPFSQAGFFGLQCFNILASLGSAFLAYRLCKQLKMKFAALSILLVLFAPVYFILVFTGLTETLFGLVLIAGVYLFFKQKYAWAAIVISFLPFARTEGLVALPLFALALAWQRKWWPILLLATGMVAYSIAGYFYYHDFLWFFTQNPYTGAKDIYGQGSLWHFFRYYDEIFGIGFTLLILLGTVALLFPFFYRKYKEPLPVTAILLILMPAALYFAAHSFLWWRGMNGSLGLTRVMAGIVPLLAVVGIKGLNLVEPWLRKQKIILGVLIALLFGFILYEPFGVHPIPFPNGPEERVLDETAAWMKKEKLRDQKVYSVNAYLFFMLDSDPFNAEKVSLTLPPAGRLESDTRPGDVVVWDAHFGPNEGRTPLDSLLGSQYFQLKALFLPDQTFLTMGGYPYEVYVFQRTGDSVTTSNYLIRDSLKANYYKLTPIFVNTFSTAKEFADAQRDNPCFRITPDMEYSPGMDTLISQYDFANHRNFEMSVDVFPVTQGQNLSLDFVSSVSYESTTYHYVRFPVKPDAMQPKAWNHIAYKFTLPEITHPKAVFKVYLWNNTKAEVFIDNLQVSVVERRQ